MGSDRGHALAEEIGDLFRPNLTFSEYNSPTYYGVNLAALRYWGLSPSVKLRDYGGWMEAELWRDLRPLLSRRNEEFLRAVRIDRTGWT